MFICKKNITFLILLIIFSCDKDGTVVVNPEQSEDIFVNNLSGYGCAGDNLCYSIDDVYYNFSGSDAFQIDFYKFNSYQLQSGNHNAEDPANILSLTSFNESHLIGIPTSSIVNESNQVLVSTLSCNLGNCADGGGGFVLEADCLEEWIAIDSENECNGNNGQWIEGEDPYEFEVQDIINQTLQSEETLDTTAQISLSSNPFSIIKNITWNKQQGRYNFVTETSEKKEMDFLYSQDYKNNTYTTLIDTTLNPIYGDIILVDENEDVERSYTIIDSLDNSEIRSTRRSEFKIKSTFVSDEDALMFKQSTDCNDNYRQDEEEMVLFAKYSMSTSSYANSFEGWCLAGSCSNDDFSFSEQDCCENNEGMWYQNTMSCEPYCINYSINCSAYTGSEDCLNSSKCAWENDLCISSVTETECEEVAGTWSSRPDKYSWDDSYATFNVDDEDLCSSTCIKSSENDQITSMHDLCWDTYVVDKRATATCQIDNQDFIINSQTGIQYYMTFCDVGNNLLDDSEVYVEQNEPPDGIWGENDNQNVEPFEDRNCNNIRDLSESLDVINDCPDYSSGDGSFCDTGNGKWDDKEDLFDLCSLELDGNCYEYQKLFQRSEAPDQLIVNYEEQALPTPFLEIYPQGNFFDTGQDGCFDIFETGNESSPCMCEFTDYNEDIPSCIDYLNDLGLLEDSNGDSFADGDLNMDEEITEFDIALISNMASIQSLNGVLFNFGANASAYNYGQCIDNFSGSKEDCCINNGCTWTNENCILDSESCLIEVDEIYWLENLDPNNDNGITELDGVWQNSEQSNFYISSNLEIIGVDTYYANELLNASLYDPYVKSPDYILTKFLDYDDDFSKGGDEIQIIEHGFEIQNKSAYAPIIESENKVVSNEVIDQIDFDDSENELLISDYIQELNKYHLVKTEFTNSSSLEDYDYMIFKGESEDVVKMIHPYYHFLPGNSYPQDINEFSDDDFWQSVDLQSDTLVYAFNGSDGNIIEGQSYHSFNSISSDTANYSIEKEYIVTSEKADLKHPVKDPNCSELNSADSCEDETNFWCRWDNDLSICESTDITSITDCLLVTRVITTTAIGPGVSYKLKSENYFKPGFGMVKEDIFIYWAALPWIDTPWYPISSIQYKTPGRSLEISQSSGFLNRKLTNIENFGNIDNFENDDYKIINTFGLQRVEYPIGY